MLVAAPKPPNYVNSERQQFADEYYYEYYYEDDEYGEYYYDDLGSKFFDLIFRLFLAILEH